jgi:hypothetical protein
MRRLTAVAGGLAAAGLFVVPGPVLADSPPPHATGGVLAAAAPVELGVTVNVDFNAHATISGHVNYRNSLGEFFRGEVDICYFQAGNIAVFAGTMKESQGTFAGNYFKIDVHDNGEGGDTPPDMIRVEGLAAPPACVPQFDFLSPVIAGNLQVHQ